MNRRLKQIIIGLILIVIISVLIFLLFLIFNASKRDKTIQSMTPPSLENLKLLNLSALKIDEGHYDLIAKIKNPNPNYGAKSFSYNFIFIDDLGNRTDEFNGESYILPQEAKYIIISNIGLKKPESSLKFKIADIKWAKLDNNFPSLHIFNKTFDFSRKDGEFAVFSGTLINQGAVRYDKVEIILMLLGASGDILTVNSTELSNISSGEGRMFRLIWSEPFEGEAKKFEVQTYANPY